MSLQLTYDEIDRQVGLLLGASRSRSDWDAEQGTDFDGDVDSCRRNGLRKFYSAYRWSFLSPPFHETLNAPYSTGTLAAVDGVVTLTGGSFPSWAANGYLVVDGSSYEIDTRDGTTQVTLVDTSVDITSGSSYTLYQFKIDLPLGFRRIVGEMKFSRLSNCVGPLQDVGESRIRQLYESQASANFTEPRLYGVYPKPFTASSGTYWQMIVWPAPSAARLLVGRYELSPEDVESSSEAPLGSVLHSQTILEAILSEAEVMLGDQSGVHARLYQERLQESIFNDRQTASPKRLGKLRDALGGPDDCDSDTYFCSDPAAITYVEGLEDFI